MDQSTILAFFKLTNPNLEEENPSEALKSPRSREIFPASPVCSTDGIFFFGYLVLANAFLQWLVLSAVSETPLWPPLGFSFFLL